MGFGRSIPEAARERVGERIGNYRIAEVLGHGGMGVVYLAEHELIGRRVAVKVLRHERSQDPEIIARFFNEAKAAALLKHPGIIEVYDYGFCPDGSAYIVMELLAGESLAARLARVGHMPESQVVALTRQIASAVGAVHAAGIIHRDLKPDNIHLVPDADAPGGERARVLDFGIAKLSLDEQVVATQTGMVFGSPIYMSPEQFRDTGKVDQRADIYALGCVAYEMACGRPPFVATTLADAAVQHMLEPPPAPRSLVPALSAGFEAVLLRALAKTADARFASMADLAAALDGGPAPGPERPRRGTSRRWIAGAALVVAAGSVAAYVAWPQHTVTLPESAVAPARRAPAPTVIDAAPLAAAAAPPSAPVEITRRIVSHPAGASVYRPPGTTSIGTTPFVEKAEPGRGEIRYQLRLSGYRDETVKLSAERDGALEVTLKRQPRERPPTERPRNEGDPIDFGE